MREKRAFLTRRRTSSNFYFDFFFQFSTILLFIYLLVRKVLKQAEKKKKKHLSQVNYYLKAILFDVKDEQEIMTLINENKIWHGIQSITLS